MPRLGVPGANHLSPPSTLSSLQTRGTTELEWLHSDSDWVIEPHSSKVQLPSKQIQPQLSQTHFRKFHNFKYRAESTNFVIMEISWINIQLLRIPSTSMLLNSYKPGAEGRSLVSLKILIWLPSHFKLGGFRRFTFTLNLNYLKIMLLVGWVGMEYVVTNATQIVHI